MDRSSLGHWNVLCLGPASPRDLPSQEVIIRSPGAATFHRTRFSSTVVVFLFALGFFAKYSV